MEKKRVRIPKDQMEARNEIIVRLYKQGMTPKLIAEALQYLYPGLTASNVSAILVKLGIPAHSPKRSEATKKAVKARWSKKAEKEDQMEMDTEAAETAEATEKPEQSEITKAGCLNMLLRVVEYMTGVSPETLLREINHYRPEAKI